MLSKGQCQTPAYRWMARNGGYAWVRTQATAVYAARDSWPSAVVCVHNVIRLKRPSRKKKTTKDVGRGASLFEASVSTAGRVLQLGRNAQVLTLAVGGASLEPVSRLLDASRI